LSHQYLQFFSKKRQTNQNFKKSGLFPKKVIYEHYDRRMSEQDTNLDLNPELGDFVTVISDKYTNTTGRIVYRDDKLLRIKPVQSDNVVDFQITEEGLFDPTIGVSGIFIKEKRDDPHYSIQLHTMLGDTLELFSPDGKSLGIAGQVTEIIATPDMDAIRLDTGKYLNFRFVGPKPAIGYIVPISGGEEEEEEGEKETNDKVEEQEQGQADVEVSQVPDFEFNPDVVPYVEEEQEQFTYSDSVQRQDMFTSFMDDVPTKKQKDPKTILHFFRTTDIFLALKNSVVVRDESGSIKVNAEPRSYIANNFQDPLTKQVGGYIPAILPVADVKRVLFVDEANDELLDGESDVSWKNDLLSIFSAQQAAKNFETSTKKEGGFLPYIFSLFRSLQAFIPKGESNTFIEADQDVLRSQIPPTEVDGFRRVPISGEEVLNTDFLEKVSTRTIRLLGPSTTKITQKSDRRTTEITYAVAQADTADSIGHIIVSEELMYFRQPIRSSVLLWDIVASERSRKSHEVFYTTLEKLWDKQQLLEADSSLVKNVEERLKPCVAFINPVTTNILDSFGLRNLEISAEIFTVLLEATKRGQAAWLKAYPKLVQAAAVALSEPSHPVFSNIADAGSPLFPESEPLFDALRAAFQEKYMYSVLKKSDLPLADELLREANCTFAPFWYAAASGLPRTAFPHVERNYTGEAERIRNNDLLKREKLVRFAAKPDINPCVHVNKYENIRSIKDDDKRMILFAKFLKQYNGGKMGEYIRCNVCKRELCCMHEVLLLNEYNHIGKKEVLHKKLLLEFAGPAFEGSYICKICGQKIKDIEYDASLEFDDEGKPLVGRTVIQGEDEDFDMLMQDEVAEKQPDFPFKGDDLVLYTNLQACFDACGMDISVSTHKDIYLRAVNGLNIFKAYLPTATRYDKGRKTELDKLKGDKQRKEFERQFPPFSQYFANAMIGCIGALAVLEFQTSSIPVPSPLPACVFSLDGFPLEETGTAAIDYVTCAMVTRKLAGSFYTDASWSLELNPKKLTTDIGGSIRFALEVILQKKKSPAVAKLTEVYMGRLADTRRSMQEDLPSHADMLPASFRPLQRFPSTKAEEPIKNAAAFQSAVQGAPYDSVFPTVVRRQHELNDDILRAFHIAAKKNVIPNTNNPRSDGSGSFTRIAVSALNGCGYRSLALDSAKSEEIGLLNHSYKVLTRKDPAKSANGTHMFVPWSAPISAVTVPEIDTTILYKLFLKHCFTGSYEGYVHEFGSDYVCRRCNFAFPKELIYLTSSEISEKNAGKMEKAISELGQQRETVILAKFKEQGVDISEESFTALEEKVRSRKRLPPIVANEPVVFLDEFGAIGSFFPTDKDSWKILVQTLNDMKEKNVFDQTDRAIKLGGFSQKYDDVLAEVGKMWYDILISGGLSQSRAKEKADLAITAFLTVTDNYLSAPRNLLNMFAVESGQIAQSQPNIKPNVSKWFPKINYNHAEELKQIWSDQASITQKIIQIKSELPEPTRIQVEEILNNLSKQFGLFMKSWVSIKPNSYFLPTEYILVLRWASLVFLRNMLTEARGSELQTINNWLLESLTKNAYNAEKYQLSDAQIQLKITEREEKERNFFIKKIDVLDGEMRKIELMKKKLGLGDWNVSSKNLFSYNSDWWEHEREQRASMGLLPEFSVTGAAEVGQPILEAQANPYGDNNDHRVQEHEDE